MALDFMDDASPHDVAEFVFDAREVIPLSDLADSFSALDRLFAKQSKTGARLAVAEIRKGSIVAVLGSGLIGHSQKMTVAARATAEKKTVGQRS